MTFIPRKLTSFWAKWFSVETDEGSLSNSLISAVKVRKYSMSHCVFPPLKEAGDKPYLLNTETFYAFLVDACLFAAHANILMTFAEKVTEQQKTADV